MLDKIREILAKHPDSKISVDYLMEELRQPPYGLRHGLFPIFLAIVAVEDEQEVAFYENGTFLREIGKDAFLRMTKAPEKFDIQYCKIEGVRSVLFQQLAEALQLPAKVPKRQIELLDIVRDLCQFAAQLPEYVRNTKQLSPGALAVRDIILEAREPVKMVFHNLPCACGFPKFEIGEAVTSQQAKDFVKQLNEYIQELRAAYPRLLQRMECAIADEFSYKGKSISSYRCKLTARAELLLVQVTEVKLKTFAFRIIDQGLSESEWLNSIGSVLTLRPTDRWKDEDENTFIRELENSAGRFSRAESISFATNDGKATRGVRVAITQPDGSERQQVVHFDLDDEAPMQVIQEQISTIIRNNERLGLVAASKALWTQLKTNGEAP